MFDGGARLHFASVFFSFEMKTRNKNETQTKTPTREKKSTEQKVLGELARWACGPLTVCVPEHQFCLIWCRKTRESSTQHQIRCSFYFSLVGFEASAVLHVARPGLIAFVQVLPRFHRVLSRLTGFLFFQFATRSTKNSVQVYRVLLGFSWSKKKGFVSVLFGVAQGFNGSYCI